MAQNGACGPVGIEVDGGDGRRLVESHHGCNRQQFADRRGRSSVSPPRAAYIHVPFCRHRCGYCNFTLVAGRDDLVGDYLRAIELELARLETPREVDTLYFGGGTPTHLAPEQLRRLGETRAARGIRWRPDTNGPSRPIRPTSMSR